MAIWVCCACGTSYPNSVPPPQRCTICEDERQFVPPTGQAWVTPEQLAKAHVNAWRCLETDLFEIRSVPSFAIGQRALLVRTPTGNVLWDCLSLLDDATKAIINAMGGLKAIAISHPHYYTSMQDWAQAFDAPVHLHGRDRDWVMRDSPDLRFWDGGRCELAPGLELIRLGGHFPGGTVLHWAAGAGGAGALLSGDIVQVAPGNDRVSFMWSYPNMLPLSADTVAAMSEALERVSFDRIYGAFAGRQVEAGAKRILQTSVRRYVSLLGREQD